MEATFRLNRAGPEKEREPRRGSEGSGAARARFVPFATPMLHRATKDRAGSVVKQHFRCGEAATGIRRPCGRVDRTPASGLGLGPKRAPLRARLTADLHGPGVIGPDHQLPAHTPGRASSGRRGLLGLVGLAVLATATALVLRQRAADRRPAPPPPKVALETVSAKRGDIGVYFESIGTVTPVHTASITSQVNGLVVAVHYAEGQQVRRGDALVDVDPRAYRATLLQAEGTLERYESVLAQARMDLERYREAWARNAIAKQLLDDQEKLVLQNEGTVKNDQGAVQYDRVQLDFCHITAPIAGRVGLRLVDPGNVVQAASASVLAVVTQLEPITVVFTLPEDKLGPVQARLRQGARLRVDALDRTGQKRIATGILLTLDNQIDTTTGTVKARALFDNLDDELFPNQFVNDRLLVDTLRGVTLIPSSAIQRNGPESFVYVIRDGVAHMRRIQTGVTDEGVTQVDGVAPGDVIADSSFDRLHDGVAVAAGPPTRGSPAP